MRKMTLIFTLMAFVAVSATAQQRGTVTFNVAATGTQENPPIEGYQTVGDGAFEINMERNANGTLVRAVASFRISYQSQQEQTPVGMHIHRGAMGTNGPVVISSGLQPGDVEAGQSGNIWRQVSITDPAGLAVVEEILGNPGGFYLNVHSTAHPPGFVRGQLQPMVRAQDLRDLNNKVDAIDRFLREFANSLGVVLR